MANDYLTLVGGDAPAAGNAYLDMLQGQRDGDEARFRAALNGGVAANPDQVAQTRRVAGYLGTTAPAVEALPQEAERAAKVKQIDQATTGSPATRRAFTDADFARLAHDDADNLVGVERALSAVAGAVKYLVSAPGQKNTLLGDIGAGFQLANRGAAGVGQAAAELPAPLLDWMEPATALGGNPLRRLAEGFAIAGGTSKAVATRLSPPTDSIVQGGVSSGVQSLTQNVLTLPMAVMNPLAALLGMSGLTGGQSYQDAREKGVPIGTALPFAASQGVVEYATEKIPMSRLLGDLAANTGFVKTLTRQLAAEIPGEQVATILQDLNEWAVLNPEKPFSAYLAERPSAAAQTLIATAVGTGGNVVLMRTLQTVLEDGSQQAQRADMGAAALEELGKLAAASKLRERDVDSFEAFVAQATVDGPVQDVFVNAKTLMQSGTAEALAAVSPSVAEQLPAALAAGGDVRIPVAEYTARIAGTEFDRGLLGHLKTEPAGMSRAEAQEYMQSQATNLEAEVQRVLAEKQGDETFKASADEVKALVRQQLDQAGRFTGNVNEAYASMVGNFYAVMAAKLGVGSQDLFSQYPLRVATERIAGEVLDQSGRSVQVGAARYPIENSAGQLIHPTVTGQQNFWRWFSDSAVVDEQGSPLVVYHGTDQSFDEFRGNSYFTPVAEDASTYSKVNTPGKDHTPNVMPVYLSMRKPKVISTYATRADIDDAREAGFDGVIVRGVGGSTVDHYITFSPEQVKSVLGNSGEFDAGDANILNQGPRGSFNPATNTITLLKNADLSTFLHEAGHFFLETQLDIAAQIRARIARLGAQDATPGELQVMRDTNALLQWFGVKSVEEWHGLDFDEKRSYHEKFARGFEAYLFEGKAPSIEMQGLFQRFRAWMLNVYRELKALDVELTDEVRAVLDRMLATGEQVQLAESGRSMLPLFTEPGQAGMTVDEFAAYQALGVDATNDAIQDVQAATLRDLAWTRNARGREIKRLQREAAERRREVRMEVRTEVMSQPVYRAWQFLTGKLTADDKAAVAPADRPKATDGIDPSRDSLFTAIAKLGGLDRAAVESQWGFDPKERTPTPVFGKPLLRRTEGLSLDAMGERLAEYGYLLPDEAGRYDLRDLEDKFEAEYRGDLQYSMAVDPSMFGPEERAGEGVNLDLLGAGRLDITELKSLGIPGEIVEHVQNLKMTARDGIHPDIVAEMFGFTSGDELVRTLVAAQSPKVEIEGLTDARMLERFGELATPEAIERAADKAIHNEARSRFVATEANALAKATGKPKILASAARDFARAMIARLRVRDIRPSMYASAEARAAKAAAKASRAGDLATAGAEKRNQLVQGYATTAAYAAQDEIESGVRYLKKFDGDGTRKALDADYLDQIDALLERFDLRKQSLKAIDKRTALAAWITTQREQGLEPDVPDDLQNEAFRKSYRDMTVEEFRGLVDTVRQIEHLGRLKDRLLTAADNRAFEAVKAEIITSIDDNAGDRTADTRTPTTNLGRAAQQLKRFAAAHIKAATWARVLDGGKDGGPMWEYFVRSANERGDQETTMRAEATIALSAILAPVFKLGQMGGKGIHFPTIGRSLNREARIALALNTGNASNLQRLLGGEGWTVADIQPVLQSLTAAEWQAVQAVWDHFEGYRPQIGAKERRVYGREPAWVEPTPFWITLADGQQVQLRGGYYPIKYDPAASQRAEEFADAEGAQRQLKGAFTSATTKRSFTKTRAEEVSGRPLLYTLAGLYSGVNDVIHDLAWHEWLIDVNRLMRSKSIDTAIRGHYGPEVKAQFKAWIADIAEGEKAADNAAEVALGRLRQGISAAGLGYNVMSASMQILGVTQSIVRVGATHFARGAMQYIGAPLATTRDVRERSAFMANRSRTRFRELNELRGQVQDESGALREVKTHAYWLMMRAQQVVDTATWLGAYDKAIGEGNADERATALADQAVIDSQGGGQLKDLAAVERGGPALKLFSVFYSFMNTALNLGVASAMTPKSRGKLAADMLLLYSVPAVLGSILKDALTPGGEDEDWEALARKLAAEQLSYLMGLMLITREFAFAAKIVTGAEGGGRDYTGPAGLRAVTDAGKLLTQAKQGEFDDAFRKAAVNLVGDLTGLPAAQTNRTVTGAKALAEGETQNPAALVFGFQKQ